MAYDREHVTPFIYSRPERFKIAGLEQHASEGEVRWTVDRPDDYAFTAAVYDLKRQNIVTTNTAGATEAPESDHDHTVALGEGELFGE